jgi:hypothetical protein
MTVVPCANAMGFDCAAHGAMASVNAPAARYLLIM